MPRGLSNRPFAAPREPHEAMKTFEALNF